MSQSSVAVPIPTQMSDAERAVRIDLAACYRLVALYGWDDLVFTHISARVPGPEHRFLINPYGMMFEEITASSLVKVDADGNALGNSPYAVNPAGFTIHSAVHEVREDAGCVIHLHTPDGTAVATSSTGLLPLNQTAQLVLPDRDEGYNCARAYLETHKSKVVKLAARLVECGSVDAAEFLRLMNNEET